MRGKMWKIERRQLNTRKKTKKEQQKKRKEKELVKNIRKPFTNSENKQKFFTFFVLRCEQSLKSFFLLGSTTKYRQQL